MIKLLRIQTMALRGLLQRARSFLNTVETAEASTAAFRNSIREDCQQWAAILLDKVQEDDLADYSVNGNGEV